MNPKNEESGKIYVAGHTGLVGSAIVRRLQEGGYTNFVFRTHEELDLTRQNETEAFFMQEKPDQVYMAAAEVGGVLVNNEKPAEFMYNNMMMTANVIHSAYKAGVKKLLYLGSCCIYPKEAAQPIREEALFTGEVEKTNEGYAMGKIAGIKLCEFYNRQYGTDFISCMPCNAYGPGDNYDLTGSHVIPALIRKFYEAKQSGTEEVVMWGSGKPIREFIYIDDIADAVVFLMEHYSGNETVNIGTGTEYSIGELAVKIKEAVGYEGRIVNDITKPDGIPRKLIDSSKIFRMGWRPKVEFHEGIRMTLKDYIENIEKYNGN